MSIGELKEFKIILPKLDLNNKPKINIDVKFEKMGLVLAKQILKQLSQVEDAESFNYDLNAKTYYATYLAGYIVGTMFPKSIITQLDKESE